MTVEYDTTDFNEITVFFRWRGTILYVLRLYAAQLLCAPSSHAARAARAMARAAATARGSCRSRLPSRCEMQTEEFSVPPLFFFILPPSLCALCSVCSLRARASYARGTLFSRATRRDGDRFASLALFADPRAHLCLLSLFCCTLFLPPSLV